MNIGSFYKNIDTFYYDTWLFVVPVPWIDDCIVTIYLSNL